MPRTYEMRARAESTNRTREAILVAVGALSRERLPVEISLADVAERAGTSVQTVLRHFGSKDALLEAAWDRMVEDVGAERDTPVGDVAAAVRAVVASYERLGDWSVRLQAQELSDAPARRAVAIGRRFHRRWVGEVFAPYLAEHPDAAELLDLLIVATDLLTWKNLRRDMGLSRAATIGRMQKLVDALLIPPA